MSLPQPASAGAPRRLTRRGRGGRVVGGVAGGIADVFGIDPTKVRIGFALLTLLGGAGIVAYGLLWLLTPVAEGSPTIDHTERTRAIGVVVLALVGAGVLGSLLDGRLGDLALPAVVIGAGAVLLWRELDTSGARGALGLPVGAGMRTWARVIGGAVLIVVGLAVMVVARVDFDSLRSSLFAVVATLVGAALLTVPLWMRLWRSLEAERAARIRTDARDEIASHLHDSVLQTLALIQKQSDDPVAVGRLARSQERELRHYLFDTPTEGYRSLVQAISTVAAEVEDQYAITVRVVSVGDLQLPDPASTAGREEQRTVTALVGAAREALVNVAKHAEVTEANLYIEVSDERVEVFVRDRGVGFDPDSVADDRQGVARSIKARLERRGGTATVKSTPARGTEVVLAVPRTAFAPRAIEAQAESEPS